MSAFLRQGTFRVLLTVPRLTAQPTCLTRPLCRIPPEVSEQGGEAKPAATARNGEAEEKLLKSQNEETQTKDHKPPQETEEKENGGSELYHLKHESSVKEEGAVGKQDNSTDKKTSNQKLHDLLSSLATADPIPVEPRVQLSRPKGRKKKAKAQGKSIVPDLDPELVSATQKVAESLGGDVKGTESELLTTLRLHSPETTTSTAPSLSELFVGMKVERKPKAEVEAVPRRLPHDSEASHPQGFPPRDQQHRPRRSLTQPPASSVPRTRVALFGGQPLGIFNKRQETSSESPAPMSLLPTWERLHLHELQQSMLHPPSNAFVEMIQWTNEGKLWTFPIDNEAGLEEEKKVGFHEHIFLERHLEGWCPQRGPIRHFMELVCVGLSKNPYLTVERKQAHIEWYKNYFKQKEELLKELGAIEVSQ